MNEEPHNLTENEGVTESLRPDPVVAEPSAQATIQSTATNGSIDSSQENTLQAGDVAESDSAGVASEPRPVAAAPSDSSPAEADPVTDDPVTDDPVTDDAVMQ